jgi:hypothetical protein
MKLKILIALGAMAACCPAQTPPQIPSTVELMQTRGAVNTALAQIAAIACVGTPGNTTGAYGQQCQTALGARYSCNNAAGCTAAEDWVFSGSMSWPSGAGIAVYNGSGAWGTSISPSSFEPALGNPSVTGYVLASTTGGTRSWIAQSGGGGSMVDILRFGICITAGCGSEATINYIATMGAGSFTECALNLAVAPTGSSVIVDVQDATSTSIFGATKLVVGTGSTSVVYQSTFAGSPQNYARGSKYKAVVLANDSGGTAQGGTVQCR